MKTIKNAHLTTLLLTIIFFSGTILSCTGQKKTGPPAKPTTTDICKSDSDCTPPLRCIDEDCQTPPAITGVITETTPRVIIESTKYAGITVYLELAITFQEQARGLMHREKLAKNWGMIFIYEKESNHSFYMKNTLIPLDMIFVNKDYEIVGIVENAEPMTLTSRRVSRYSQFIIEVPGGFCRQQGIAEGSKVRFEHIEL